MNPFLRVVLWMLAIAFAVLLLLFGAYFLHGSLEEFPTSEQHDKVRLVSGIGLLFFSGLEALVIFALIRMRRRSRVSSAEKTATPPRRWPSPRA